MAKKVLKMLAPEKCIGCEMCVLEVQRQLGKVGLNGSLIRIFRDSKKGISIDLDPRINQLNLEKLREVCPLANYYVDEEGDEYELLD